jgi:hypothetical protein
MFQLEFQQPAKPHFRLALLPTILTSHLKAEWMSGAPKVQTHIIPMSA